MIDPKKWVAMVLLECTTPMVLAISNAVPVERKIPQALTYLRIFASTNEWRHVQSQ
jgi:hypothetical protein